MKRCKVVTFYILCITIGMIIPTTSVRSSINEKQNFYGVVHEQAMKLNSYFSHGKGALSDYPSSSRIIATANSLAASTLFTEYKKGGSPDLNTIAQRVVNSIKNYFINDFHSDKRGFTSMYDFTMDIDSFVKNRKFAHDQYLMLLALANSFLEQPDDEIALKDRLMSLFNETKAFIEDYYFEPNNTWIDSLFTYNLSIYTQNKFILVEHICWTIWAVLNLPSGFSSPLSITMIEEIVEFLHEKATFNGAILNALTPTGDSGDEILKLRTNALYGIINLLLYNTTTKSKFLDRGKAVFDFLVDKFWGTSFDGFFDAVDKEGLLVVQGKSLAGNALSCLLASRLSRYYPNNATIKSIYVLTNAIIEEFLHSPEKFKYYISSDHDGDPLKLYSLDSNLIRLWQRSNSLHIINGIYDNEVEIGEEIRIDLKMDNPDNLTYVIEVYGDEIDPVNQTSSDTQVSLSIPLKTNSQIGYSSITIVVKVLKFTIDTSDSLTILIGSDRRLPQGLVYIVALGGLIAMVIIARYPPKVLEDLLERVTSLSVIEETKQILSNSKDSNDDNIPQGEEKLDG